MPYADVANKRNELQRKAINGSALIAPYSAPPITSLTAATGSAAAITTTLSANTLVAATSITTAATIPQGRSITIGTGGAAETVTTTGAPSGTGPFTIPVPALSKAHTSGDAVVASAVTGGVDLVNFGTVYPAYRDAGFMTTAGIVLNKSINTNETSSWGSPEPTRSDMISQTTTAQIVMQETTITSVGLYLGMDLSSVVPDAATGEVAIDRPVTPPNTFYRVLALGVDPSADGEIYIARFLPRCKVTNIGNQNLSTANTDGVTYDVTLTAYADADLGYAERFIFAGPGWQAILADTGFGQAG